MSPAGDIGFAAADKGGVASRDQDARPQGHSGVAATPFTPGPWFVLVRAAEPGVSGRPAASFVCPYGAVHEDEALARVYTMDGLAERDANACLIAAAPSLLKAATALVRCELAAAVAMIECDDDDKALDIANERADVFSGLMDDLRDAIASAEGRS